MPLVREVSETDYSLSLGGSIGNPEEQVRSFAKHMLVGRLFIGSFQEKRYVDSLQSYRDVIVVANEETDLIRDLEVVKNRVRGYYGHDYWIGITGRDMIGAPAGHCLWVELPEEIFGSYWYKISKIRFRANEVILRIKVIRPVSATTVISADRHLGRKVGTDTSPKNTEDVADISYSKFHNGLIESLTDAKTVVLNNLYLFFKTVITIQNTKEVVKFISVLLVALATGFIRCIEFLGDFSIKFMQEMSVCLTAATPIVIAFINLIGKVIGGFYLLILGMWRSRSGPPPVHQSLYFNSMNPRVGSGYNSYNTVYLKRALPAPTNRYRDGGVRITRLD